MPESGGPEPTIEQEIRIERLVAGGDGLGFLDGLAVFVTGGVPGDRLRVALQPVKSGHARADLLEVLEPGPGRRPEPCPVARRCGGCSLQHLEYPRQLELKQAILRESFARIGRLELPESLPAHASAEWGYRLRADLKLAWNGGRPTLGFHARRSHEVVAIEGCPVLGPGFAALWRPLVRLLNQRAFLFRGLAEVGFLEGEEGALVVLRFTREPGRRGELFESLRWLSSEAGLAGASIETPRGRSINWGAARVSMGLGKYRFAFEPGVFVQTNRTLAESMWRRARELAAARPASAAFDLYGGAAFFALALADHFPSVTSVEADSRAARLARANIAANSLAHVRQVEQSVARFATARRGELEDRFVLVNPPRQGLEPETRASLAGCRARALLYVSCDPATLARDAAQLVAGGYAIAGAEIFDLFPHTPHFETLALFER